MDWMYKGLSGHVDREEYLTGRKIDKTFEMIEKEENPNANRSEEESAFVNQIANNNFIENLSKNDLIAKMREDPLFAIKMKQHEQRKEILQNPVKLKHLQEILKTSLKKDKKHKKEKKKSKKKHKSKKDRRSVSRSRSKSPERRKRYSSSESSLSENSRQSSKHSHRSSHHSQKDRHRREDDYKRNSRSELSNSHKERRIPSSSGTEWRLGNHERKSIQERHKPKLSQEEIQRRREEMISNFAWREKDRSENVHRLTEREKEEDKQLQSSSSSGAKFIKPLLSNIAGSTSIENSIRQKKFTSQKGAQSMESNFARR